MCLLIFVSLSFSIEPTRGGSIAYQQQKESIAISINRQFFAREQCEWNVGQLLIKRRKLLHFYSYFEPQSLQQLVSCASSFYTVESQPINYKMNIRFTNLYSFDKRHSIVVCPKISIRSADIFFKEIWTIHNWLIKPPSVCYLRLTYGTKYDMSSFPT